MRPLSIWLHNAGVHTPRAASTFNPFPAVSEAMKEMNFDSVVVGGGVFGCTTAWKLKCLGHKVALVEARSIGSGVSSYSTAKLSAQQGPIYSTLTTKHNDHVARVYYDMNMEGISIIEDIVNNLQIDCEFARRDSMLWTAQESSMLLVREEHAVCERLRIPCRLMNIDELEQEFPRSVGAKLGLTFPDQAMFNPYMYCKELAKHINGDGSQVFEDTRVYDVKHTHAPLEIKFEDPDKAKLTATNVVLATHLPILDRSMHFAMLEPSRSHCIAARLKTKCVHRMSNNIEMPMRSIRTTCNDEILIVCGDSISQGEDPDTDKYYLDLQDWTLRNFDVAEIVCKWSAMDYFSGDHIPFMGYLYRGTKNIFTATGFSKWGLANGAAGAKLICDLISREDNEYHHIVDARRWDLTRQWSTLIGENVHTATHFVKDKIKAFTTKDNLASLEAGHGGIVQHKMQTVGAFRDEDGKLFVVNPVCTHLGCTLVFNQGDKVWDCPCHGSQFSVTGDVIHGPACKKLERYPDLEW